MAALSSKPVNPRSLNPYRSVKKPEYTVDDIERSHRVLAKSGKVLHQTITTEQVVDG